MAIVFSMTMTDDYTPPGFSIDESAPSPPAEMYAGLGRDGVSFYDVSGYFLIGIVVAQQGLPSSSRSRAFGGQIIRSHRVCHVMKVHPETPTYPHTLPLGSAKKGSPYFKHALNDK